ncbi:MAG: hypothetical protein AAF449_02975 [Myxococcota bacterium]
MGRFGNTARGRKSADFIGASRIFKSRRHDEFAGSLPRLEVDRATSGELLAALNDPVGATEALSPAG